MATLNLNDDEIYYGADANWLYWSVSQYKDFVKCEAAALAKLKNEFKPDFSPKALLVGNYVHSYFESKEAHENFVTANKKELYSSRKPYGLLKEFQVADKMIERIESEQLFKYLWQGAHEVPITGFLHGVEWKGKLDLLNVEKGYFIDLKTTAQLDKRFYNPNYGMYVSFIEEYGYVLQMAVYEQLLEQRYGKPFTGYIYAVTKQDIPNVAAIEIEAEKKRFELNLLADKIERVEQVKTGQIEPAGCGHCEYCRQNKQLSGFVTASSLVK
jgi:hypothetical protein